MAARRSPSLELWKGLRVAGTHLRRDAALQLADMLEKCIGALLSRTMRPGDIDTWASGQRPAGIGRPREAGWV